MKTGREELTNKKLVIIVDHLVSLSALFEWHLYEKYKERYRDLKTIIDDPGTLERERYYAKKAIVDEFGEGEFKDEEPRRKARQILIETIGLRSECDLDNMQLWLKGKCDLSERVFNAIVENYNNGVYDFLFPTFFRRFFESFKSFIKTAGLILFILFDVAIITVLILAILGVKGI